MSSKLSDVGLRFKGRYKLASGGEFFGQLLMVPPATRAAHYIYIERLLRTGVNSPVAPGSVIICDGITYIVGEHAEETIIRPISTQFKLFRVTDQLEWKQQRVVTDSVTGVKTTVRDQSQGTVFLYMQPSPDLTDKLGVGQVTKQAICNKPVAVDDMVGPYIVTKSDLTFGVTALSLRLP